MTSVNAKTTFETEDVNSRWTWIVGWGFAGLLIIMGLFLWGVYHTAIRDWWAHSSSYSLENFPAPRLLDKPESPLEKLRAQERRELNTYSWNDATHRQARIPVERAMILAAEKGLIVINRGDRHAR